MKPKHEKANGNDTDRHYKSDTDAEENEHNESNSSRSRSRSRSRKSTEKSSKSDKVDHDVLSIYIGNVDYSATEEELRDMFIGCGDIIRVTIIKNMRTGHSKGAAFIEFTDKDGVNAAMQLNGKELKGRPLIITSKKPRPEKRSSSTRPSSTRHDSSRSSRHDYSSRSSRVYSSRSSNGGPSSRPMPRRLPPMMPPMRGLPPRYDPYRRPPPEFYADPYGMMQRPGPPMYHSSKMHGRPPMARPPPRYHPYSYRK